MDIKNVAKKVSDTFQEKLETISVIFSGLGFILTTFHTVNALIASKGRVGDQVSFISLAFATFFLIVLVLGLAKHNSRLFRSYVRSHQDVTESESKIETLEYSLERLAESNKHIYTCLHNFVDGYKKLQTLLYTDLLKNNVKNYSQRSKQYEKFILSSLVQIKEIFDVLTYSRCAVCIKLIDEKLNVQTYFRDPVSFRARKKVDLGKPSYPYHDNTAFKNILDPELPDDFFMSNDLDMTEGYVNSNLHRKDYYNAALVVPIRILDYEEKEKVGKERWRTLGFVCVDNQVGGFTKESSDILFSLGSQYFFLLRAINDLTKIYEAKTTKKRQPGKKATAARKTKKPNVKEAVNGRA